MKQFRDITVLITAAGNVFMPGITTCLKDNGERKVRLIGADMNDDPTILQMCDAYYSVPRGDDPSYVDVLLNICKKENVDVVLPIMSVELNALAKNRDRFSRIGTKVSVSDYKTVEIANDKIKLFDYMTSKGIPCAKYYVVHNTERMKEATRSLDYPNRRVCLKVGNRSGSRGFRILDESRSRFDMFLNEKPTSCYVKLSEMTKILSESDTFPELMLMEYLPGREYTVDLLANHGEVLYKCCRRSLGMENGIMLNSVVEDNQEVLNLCQQVTESLKLDGNIGYDVMEREDGTPFIVECNPRITAGIPVFKLAGVNLPYLNVKRLLNEDLPECKLEYGKIVRRRWMEM